MLIITSFKAALTFLIYFSVSLVQSKTLIKCRTLMRMLAAQWFSSFRLFGLQEPTSMILQKITQELNLVMQLKIKSWNFTLHSPTKEKFMTITLISTRNNSITGRTLSLNLNTILKFPISTFWYQLEIQLDTNIWLKS